MMYMLNPALSSADQPGQTYLPQDPVHHREGLEKEQPLRWGGTVHENFLLPSFLSLMVTQNNRQISTSSLFYIYIYMCVSLSLYIYIYPILQREIIDPHVHMYTISVNENILNLGKLFPNCFTFFGTIRLNNICKASITN